MITLERGDTFDAIAQLDALLAQLGPDSDFIQELAIDGQRLLESGKHSWKVEGKIVDLIAVKDKARRLRESLSDWQAQPWSDRRQIDIKSH